MIAFLVLLVVAVVVGVYAKYDYDRVTDRLNRDEYDDETP